MDRIIAPPFLAALMAISGCSVSTTPRPKLDRLEFVLQQARTQRGIRVAVEGPPVGVPGTDYQMAGVTGTKVRIMVGEIYLALYRYPPSFLRKIGLREVFVTESLKVGSRTTPSLAYPAKGLILMDTSCSVEPLDTIEFAFHRELCHFALVVLKGDIHWRDPEWEKCNPPGFSYGTARWNLRGSMASVLNHPKLGFVAEYAQSSEDEDMAEVQGMMMQPRYEEVLNSWRKTDPYLDKKCNYLGRVLAPLFHN